jgi:uncharacterized membrane protein
MVFPLLLAVLLGPGAPTTLAAQGRSLVVEHFDGAVDVRRTGEILVEETIRVRFTGSWNGIYRTIPVQYETPQGFAYQLRVEVRDVLDESGNPLRVEQSRDRHYLKLKVWIPNARDATRTVRLRYRVPNGLKFFEEHDELYWNVTGDEWDVPIQSASATILLPEGATGLRAAAFTGGYGSTDQAAQIQEVSGGFVFRTERPLNFGEGLTIAVAWDPGVVERPSALDRAGGFFRANSLFLIPILAWALMLWLWHTRGRDPASRAIVPRYEPPVGLTPAEVGMLVDGRVDSRDISSTVVDLAVRGFLRIEEREKKGFLGFGGGVDYVFHSTRPASEWSELQSHERAVLRGIFDGGSVPVRDLEDLEQEFYRELSGIKAGIFSRMRDLGYYRHRPSTVVGIYAGAGVGAIALFLAIGIFLSARTFVAPLTLIVAGTLTALAFFVVGPFMPARTVAGARAREEILGFQEFLERVEEDRFRRMITSPDLFERFLPHAMALGVEKRWARAFEGLLTEPPDWYVGHHPVGVFHTTHFMSNLSQMTTATSTAMASQPRSSGGSGFGGGGGGGFSGGGFGGGGGGGF